MNQNNLINLQIKNESNIPSTHTYKSLLVYLAYQENGPYVHVWGRRIMVQDN